MMTDTIEVDDLVKRATYALEDMQGRVDAGKLAMFADCIDRIEALAAKLAKVEAERDQADKLIADVFADAASNNIRLAEASHRAEAAEARIAHLENHIEAVAKDTHKIMVAYEAALVAACGTLRKIANGPDNAEPELWAAQALYTAAELMARIQTGETDNGMA